MSGKPEVTSSVAEETTDEFALLPENAAEAGLAWRAPTVRRVDPTVDGRVVSAIAWGGAPARLVMLHGGGQNAHTWDTVVLHLLDRFPDLGVLAVDLPGHGHSDWRDDKDYSPRANAVAVAAVLDALAPSPALVVGMSLGGLSTIRLAATRPDLVPRMVIVDVTPAARERHRQMTTVEKGTTALIGATPTGFGSFEEMLEATVAAAPPSRGRAALRRGVLHNSRRDAGGRWVWRYDRGLGTAGAAAGHSSLWDDLADTTAPITLVRGGASAFVADADADELTRRRPGTEIHVVPGAGHSVQSDAPAALAGIVAAVLATAR